MKNMKKAFLLIAVLIAAFTMASCTTERDAVDKTPDVTLDKNLFEGEFFYRTTITELPYTADYAFIGESNDGSILKWKITEHWLIAYNVHDGVEVVDTAEQTAINETPVLAFPILGHFDILPAENPTTGEDMPMLVMNTDRDWNERRYFIVDETREVSVNYELKYFWLTQEWGAPFYEAVFHGSTDFNFYAHDGSYIPPKKYKDMLAAQKDREKEVERFDLDLTMYLHPINSWAGIYNWSDIEEFVSDEPARVVTRHNFTKVNRDVVGRRTYDPKTMSMKWKKGSKDNGFRPLEYQDELFRKFGYFTNKFRGYDPNDGYRENNYHVLANIFNIAWAKQDGKEWNFKCYSDPSEGKSKGTADKYNDCLKDLKHQHKILFTSSPETPRRMLPINCAMAKDYNHAYLAARFAAMNPGSDTREFEKWYKANYEKDFYDENGDRDLDWFMVDFDQLPSDWEEKCFVKNEDAVVQDWFGNLKEDKLINEIAVLVKNPVEGYIPARDGRHLADYSNYDNFENEGDENGVEICVPAVDAEKYDGKKVVYFETCETNEVEMENLYVEEFGREYWKGDRYGCKVFKKDETCSEGNVKVKAACAMTDQYTCKVYDAETGAVKLRHKYMNGDMRVAMFNWVDQPTEYGILGVSQWVANPETGQTLGAGSNIAGSVLQWSISRSVELARMLIEDDDEAAWDWNDLVHPDYEDRPDVVWDNNPETAPRSLKHMDSDKINNQTGSYVQNQLDRKALLDKYRSKSKMQNRMDWNALKGTKWENKMVPYSIKKSLFPWVDPNNGNYTDEMKDIMDSWFMGPDAMEAEMLRKVERMKACYMEESFLDGAIIQFIKEKQAEGYTGEDLIKVIEDDLEKLLYKGVAQHEMGHSVGLRHNFIASMDKMNYLDGYFAEENYPAMLDGIKTKVKEMSDNGEDPATMGRKIHTYKKGFESDMNFYTYTSIMDYQREPYIHSVGLGKYDLAALKFAYGRTVEIYDTNGNGSNDVEEVVMDDTSTIRHPDFKFPVLLNFPFTRDDGKLMTLKDAGLKAKDLRIEKETDETGKLQHVMRLYPRAERDSLGAVIADRNSEDGKFVMASDSTYLIDDEIVHKYLFYSDEKSYDEPGNKVFDAGFSGADSVRNMAEMEDMYYYLRYFRRGNPRFREFRGRTSYKMILDTYFKYYKFVHYLLDLNYNILRGGWFNDIAVTACGQEKLVTKYGGGQLDSSTFTLKDNPRCQEYRRAAEGQEYWIDGNDNLNMLTPLGAGDYLIAGMEGVNFLINDVIYRPDAELYVHEAENPAESDRVESNQTGIWKPNPYILDEDSIINGGYEGQIGGQPYRISAEYGRYHRDRYDIQNDPSVYYEKVIRRGFAEEKMVALFTLSNQGWMSGKYRRESMANGLGQQADGINKLIFAVLSDIANEDALTSFSPYCIASTVTSAGNVEKVHKLVKANLPVNYYMTWDADPPFYDGSGLSHPIGKNVCANIVDPENPTWKYEPAHAGWIYFDKMWPLYWGMGNVMNSSADSTVLYKFVSLKYAAYEKDLYPEADVDEIETRNSAGNFYYRAKIATSDLDGDDLEDLVSWKECIETGDEATCLAGLPNENTFTSKEEYSLYLKNKYMRINPAYRLIWNLNKLIGGESNTTAASADPASAQKVTIMQTTLDQMNAFAQDHFRNVVLFAKYY